MRILSQLGAGCRSNVGFVCAGLLFGGAAFGFNSGLREPPPGLDRSSPFATVQGFLNEARAGRFADAAQDLWLDELPPEQQASEGARLARRLRFVLDRQALDLKALPKEGESGPGSVVLTSLEVAGRPTPVRLVRLRTADGPVWLFSKDTVGAVDALYEAYGPPLPEPMPAILTTTRLGLELWQWLGLLLGLVLAVVVGWLGEKLVLAALERLARLTPLSWDSELVVAARGPLKLPLAIVAFRAVTSRLLLDVGWESWVGLVCQSLAIIAATWFVLRALNVASRAMDRQLVTRGGSAAGTRTQMVVLWRVLTVIVYVLGLAAFLMQFNGVRTVGLSLLASAGVAGVVVGLAAQKSIGALISGIQLSLSQPIRIGDSVVVEGESGTVAEISLSYVVLRLWDNRHLVVPVSYFLEKPFQNWSRGTADMVGVVLLQLDYRVDVAALRQELDRILAGPGKPLWNGRLAKVQVVEATAETATVRILVSAANADDTGELRCLVREHFLVFLRAHPEWLPTRRLEQRRLDEGN